MVNQTIIFCSTRKSAQMTAEFLANTDKFNARKGNAKRAASPDIQ